MAQCQQAVTSRGRTFYGTNLQIGTLSRCAPLGFTQAIIGDCVEGSSDGYCLFNDESVVISNCDNSLCPTCITTPPPPQPVPTGTTPTNPTNIQPTTITTGTNALTQQVQAPPTTDPKLPSGYINYKPKTSTYEALELGLTNGLYLGQQILMREDLLLTFELKNPELINYAYKNRPIPYALGGWYNIGVKDAGDRVQIGDAGEILINLLNPGLYQAFISRTYASSVFPKKGDFYGGAIGTIEGCNLKMAPSGVGNFIPSGVITLPEFFFSSSSPLATMKVPVVVLDLANWEYESSFQNVGFYIDNAWQLLDVAHSISRFNAANEVQNPIQIPTSISCSTAGS